MEKKILLIDLASAPGGVDAEVARGLGLPVVWALSLPGKYAPVTAGEIIADTVLSMLKGGEPT
jgi:dipicolinate synthase subunit A